MKIFIKTIGLSGSFQIEANDREQYVLLNGKKIDCNAIEFVGELSAIMCSWENEYINNSIIDGTEYKIKIINDYKEEKIITIKNAYPHNFEKFSKLIQGVIDL